MNLNPQKNKHIFWRRWAHFLSARTGGRYWQIAIVCTLLFVALFLMCMPTSTQAGEAWQLKKDAENIKVYYRDRPDGYTEFRGVTQIQSRLSSFIALFRDLESMPLWVDRTLQARRLEKRSDTEVYAHVINDVPWPFKDREVVIHTIIAQDPIDLTVTIRGSDDPNYSLPKADYVRMTQVKSHWSFKPLPEGKVEVRFQGYGDAGGKMSSDVMRWFIDLVLWESPFNTLRGMRKIIQNPKYQEQSFPFIKELSK